MSMVRPGARSARQTARLVATVVTPSPPLVENTEVMRPVRWAGWGARRRRRSFSSAAARSAAWTGRRRNSTAPARMISMTKSAARLRPVAKTAASGKARARISTIRAGGPSGPAARSSGRSTTTRSGRRDPPSWAAWATRLNSPTSCVDELSASRPRTGEPGEPTKMVRRGWVMSGAGSFRRHAALAEGHRYYLAHARNAGHQGEVLLLLGPQIHEPARIRPGPGRVGLDELSGHEEDELGLVVLEAGTAEEGSQDRDVAEH